jgi:hypothetical protein
MPLTREAFFVFLAVIASLIRYGGYCLSIYRKQTKPHVFTWFNWGLVVAIGAYAQFQLHGGPSVWGLAFVAVTCFAISLWALFIGEKNITLTDWGAFVGAALAVALWKVTNNPVTALLLLIVFDIFSYWPTIRKSWADPWSEPPESYFWAGLRYFFLLFAVPAPTAATLLYPFWLMVTDWAFMLYVFWRRRALHAKA